ncbi:DUF421 domain-containing protein [Portibacter marinus]|uniref:DUF421 domain-containing protein n=1 Tax=Portibacter marinus TaxID=2898660 RepID=UPI001F159769|nr:YetF domain-containing protein [Portibacter marinus]
MTLDYFDKDFHLILESAIGTTVIIGLIILYTRIFGLKSFSKMTGFDFIITIIIGNVAAMALSTGRPGLYMGMIILTFAFVINYLITYFLFKSEKVESIVENKPVFLMRDGKMNEENMKKCKVTVDELRGKLREANVLQLHQAKAVILETTGDVSVLHSDQDIEIDDFILKGIQ